MDYRLTPKQTKAILNTFLAFKNLWLAPPRTPQEAEAMREATTRLNELNDAMTSDA